MTEELELYWGPGSMIQYSTGRLLHALFDSPGENTGVCTYPFSSGSSLSRNQNGVSCIEGDFFTNWAMREAPNPEYLKMNHTMHFEFPRF